MAAEQPHLLLKAEPFYALERTCHNTVGSGHKTKLMFIDECSLGSGSKGSDCRVSFRIV